MLHNHSERNIKVQANYPTAGPNNVKNLFFPRTEDFIQKIEVIRKSLSRLIKKIGENLAAVCSVIKQERQYKYFISSLLAEPA